MSASRSALNVLPAEKFRALVTGARLQKGADTLKTISPSVITGGCLCESLRYAISVTESKPLPFLSHTCQCTQCRKGSGSLIPQWVVVAGENVFWRESITTFAEYEHTTGCLRGFCSKCGSTMTWRSSETESFQFTVGTIDEVYLIGDRVNRISNIDLQQPGAWKTLVGEKEAESGQTALAHSLVRPNTHYHLKNAVIGVTDILQGDAPRNVEGDDEELPM